MSRLDIKRIAEGIIQREFPQLLKIPGQTPVLQFFERLREHPYSLKEIGVRTLPPGVLGLTLPTFEVYLSENTYIDAENGQGRARFTVAHEAFHGLHHCWQLHDRLEHRTVALFRRNEIPTYRDPEWQANCFAAEFLMPEPAMRVLAAAHDRSTTSLQNAVVSVFGVSYEAAGYRLTKLRLAE